MLKRFTICCFALAMLVLPATLGCAGRPPAPTPSTEGESHDLDTDTDPNSETMIDGHGNEMPKSDAMQPID